MSNSFEPRDFKDPKWIYVRTECYRRDKYTCLWCGRSRKKDNRVVLNAHHIKRWADYPNLRFYLPNLITLCKECHQKVWGKEEQYEVFFRGLIRKKKDDIDSILWLLEKKYNDTP